MSRPNILQSNLSDKTRKIIDDLALKMGISKSNVGRDLIHEALKARGHDVSENVPHYFRKKPIDQKQQ